MRYTKDILYPGTYRLSDGRTVTYSPADVEAMANRLNEMIDQERSIPICWEHQDDAKPTTPAERLADRAKFNIGFVERAILTPEGYLAAELDVPSQSDANRLPSVRFVSPEIIENYRDGVGHLWPGKTITHIAITPRPIQHQQSTFVPIPSSATTRMSVVRLSLGDFVMTDEKPERKSANEESEVSGEDCFKKALKALEQHGIPLPSDTTSENFMERLVTALHALGSSGEKPKDQPKAESNNPGNPGYGDGVSESPMPAMLSNHPIVQKLLVSERNRLAADVDRLLETGRINKKLHGQLKAELVAERLSLTDDGDLAATKVAAKIEAYQQLDPVGFAKQARMSQASIQEAAHPWDEEDDLRNMARERAKTISVNGKG